MTIASPPRQIMLLIEAIKSLAEALDIAVVLTDGDLRPPGPRIILVNSAFERMTGYTAAEVTGRSPRMLQGARTSLASRVSIRQALRAGAPHTSTLVNYRKNGEAYHCEIQLFPIHDPSGQMINVVAMEREVPVRPGRKARPTK